eukprot:PhM_4_TR4486/c1_g1_i1/m.64728
MLLLRRTPTQDVKYDFAFELCLGGVVHAPRWRELLNAVPRREEGGGGTGVAARHGRLNTVPRFPMAARLRRIQCRPRAVHLRGHTAALQLPRHVHSAAEDIKHKRGDTDEATVDGANVHPDTVAEGHVELLRQPRGFNGKLQGIEHTKGGGGRAAVVVVDWTEHGADVRVADGAQLFDAVAVRGGVQLHEERRENVDDVVRSGASSPHREPSGIGDDYGGAEVRDALEVVARGRQRAVPQQLRRSVWNCVEQRQLHERRRRLQFLEPLPRPIDMHKERARALVQGVRHQQGHDDQWHEDDLHAFPNVPHKVRHQEQHHEKETQK